MTAIRPLGQSAGPGFPAVFPHDMEQEIKIQANRTNVIKQVNERALLSWYVKEEVVICQDCRHG